MNRNMGSLPTLYLQFVKGSRDLFFGLWDPSISRKRLELETSYLGCIGLLTTRGTNEKNAKLGQRVGTGSRDVLLKFRDPLHIS